MRHYCSLMDANYLAKGLTLYVSMERHCMPFRWHVLALDDQCAELLAEIGLDHIQVHRAVALEAHFPDLAALKSNRSTVEYFFTQKAFLPGYLFAAVPEMAAVTLIDADAWFFGSPDPVFEALPPETTVGLCPHRFPPNLKDLEAYGVYNAGWVHWVRSEATDAILAWYRDRVSEWCRDEPDGPGRFAEQGYLQRIPDSFDNVAIFDHIGINSAPWNLSQYQFAMAGEDQPTLDGIPILYHHFHAVREQPEGGYSAGLEGYEGTLTDTLSEGLYHPYLLCLSSMEKLMLKLCPELDFQSSLRKECRTDQKDLERHKAGQSGHGTGGRDIIGGVDLDF